MNFIGKTAENRAMQARQRPVIMNYRAINCLSQYSEVLVLNLFRKKEWELSAIEGITHKENDVQVSIDRMPCRIEKTSGKRRYPYPDYGFDLATHLGKFVENNFKIFMPFHSIKLSAELGVKDTVITITTSQKFENSEALKSEILEVLADAIKKTKIKSK
jgi:hypothetical protein